jgi:hypothetical protein
LGLRLGIGSGCGLGMWVGVMLGLGLGVRFLAVARLLSPSRQSPARAVAFACRLSLRPEVGYGGGIRNGFGVVVRVRLGFGLVGGRVRVMVGGGVRVRVRVRV